MPHEDPALVLPPPIPANLGTRGKAGITKSSHAAGPTVVPSDLICRQTQQISLLKKPVASTASAEPCRFHQFCPTDFHVHDTSCLCPFLHFPSCPQHNMGRALAANTGSAARHEPKKPMFHPHHCAHTCGETFQLCTCMFLI